MCVQFISFLHTDITQAVEIPPRVRQELYLMYIDNIIGDDFLATMLNRTNSVPVI